LLLAVVLDRSGDTVSARWQRDSTMQRAAALDLQEPLLFLVLGRERVRHGELREARSALARLQAVAIRANPRHVAVRMLLQAELDAAEGRLVQARARADSGVALDETNVTLDTQARVYRRVAEVSGDTAMARLATEADRRLAARQEFGWEGTLAWMEARARLGGGALDHMGEIRR
jgi:hypothetical protein